MVHKGALIVVDTNPDIPDANNALDDDGLSLYLSFCLSRPYLPRYNGGRLRVHIEEAHAGDIGGNVVDRDTAEESARPFIAENGAYGVQSSLIFGQRIVACVIVH